MSALLLPEPPHSIDLEQAVLGAIMLFREAYPDVAASLRSEHFYVPQHAVIYAAMQRLIESGEIADQNTLINAVIQDPELNELEGGPRKYLATCAHTAPPAFSVASYGRQLINLHARRAAMERAQELQKLAAAETCEPADLYRIARELQDLQIAVAPDDLQGLDWNVVADLEPPAQRWLIQDWHPVGYAGFFAGAGAAGKSFLEILKAICLASGKRFLGYEVERCRTVSYFSEDDQDEIWRRAKRICASLQIDPRILQDDCLLVSTYGRRLNPLFVSDGNEVQPTDFFERVAERARREKRRYVSFDHLKRLCAIETETNTFHAFSLFNHLDAFSAEIDGTITMIVHPSKSNVSNLGTDPFNPMAHIGGVGSLTQAPRFVHTLSKQKIDNQDTLVLANAKPNRAHLFGIKLSMDDHGVAQFDGDYEPAKPDKKKETPRDGVLRVLSNLYAETERPVPIDDLVQACIDNGLYAAAPDKPDFRARKQKVSFHLKALERSGIIQLREGERWAIMP